MLLQAGLMMDGIEKEAGVRLFLRNAGKYMSSRGDSLTAAAHDAGSHAVRSAKRGAKERLARMEAIARRGGASTPAEDAFLRQQAAGRARRDETIVGKWWKPASADTRIAEERVYEDARQRFIGGTGRTRAGRRRADIERSERAAEAAVRRKESLKRARERSNTARYEAEAARLNAAASRGRTAPTINFRTDYGPSEAAERKLRDVSDQLAQLAANQQSGRWSAGGAALAAGVPLAAVGGLALRSAAKAQRARRNTQLAMGGLGAAALMSHSKAGRAKIDELRGPEKTKLNFLFRRPGANVLPAGGVGAFLGGLMGAGKGAASITRAGAGATRHGAARGGWTTAAMRGAGRKAKLDADNRVRRTIGAGQFYTLGGSAGGKEIQNLALSSAPTRSHRGLIRDYYLASSKPMQDALNTTGGKLPSIIKQPEFYTKNFGDIMSKYTQRGASAGATLGAGAMFAKNTADRARQIETVKKWAVPGALGLGAYALMRN